MTKATQQYPFTTETIRFLNRRDGKVMAYGTSMKLMWEIMERLCGAVCEYHDSQIVLDQRALRHWLRERDHRMP